MRCDFYLPAKKIVIEYNGSQHYKPVSLFGGKQAFEVRKNMIELRRIIVKKMELTLRLYVTMKM